jgi:two-component system, OmpR family, sensor histidine kinase PhoQ
LLVALNFALSPLKVAEQQIEQVSLGHADRVNGVFPAELRPLTSSINRLLESELLQKQRYRDTLGNLAHSLKTPLAIIASEIQKDQELSNHKQVFEQLERINDIVKYQLNRSVVTAGQSLQRKSKVKPQVDKIVEALKKVHAIKRLSINAEISLDCLFPGETGDLMELVGNISDNACKWAKSTVHIKAETILNELVIYVEDDGPGIPENQRSLILNRGKRLDQQAEGQGLGLSIVMDIIKLYRGELLICQSELGGSKFIIKLPV